jgi:hypothetical protein
MATPTILYLHGFVSSPRSAKAQLFARAVAALPPAVRPRLHVPQLPFAPAAAIAGLAAWIDAEQGAEAPAALTIVGSSLGGYYATVLAERYGVRAALINPTTRPYDDLRPYAGPQENPYTGERFDVPPASFAELAQMKVARITRPERYFLLQRSGDELLDWREAVAFYAGAAQYVAGGGDHGWVDFATEIPPILRFAGVSLPAR